MTDSDKESRHFSVSLARHRGYQFLVDFQERDLPALTLDEPPPLGEGRGPNASRVLAAAVGDCLSASLLYCLERAKIPGRISFMARSSTSRDPLPVATARLEPARAAQARCSNGRLVPVA